MQYYIDIRVWKNPEIPSQVLLNTLFEKIHLILAEQKRTDVGVSFPEISRTLGEVLRLHGGKEALEAVAAHRFFNIMRDYAQIGRIMEVPADAGNCNVNRVQAKSGVERLRRRRIKRHGISEEQAIKDIPDTAAEMLDLPFISLNSRSTGQKFRLYVRQRPCAESCQGEFSAYGFSGSATVPAF